MTDRLARKALLTGAISLIAAGQALAAPAVPRFVLTTPEWGSTSPFPVCDEDHENSEEGSGSGSESLAEPEPGPPEETEIGSDPLDDLSPINCHNETDPAGPTAKPEATRAVSRTLEEGRDFCSYLPSEARVGCIADRFRKLADDLPRGGDYAPVREALRQGARELEAITRANAAPATSRKRYEVVPPDGSARQRSGPITSVAPDRVAAANRAAAAVIDKTQTVLLRSAQNSRERMVHYQEIATAIDSTKVLLRST